MGMIYRRKKRDPTTGILEEQGPYWMKYYIEGRPIQESTKTFDKDSAKRVLKIKEGEIASGHYRGPSMDRVYFEDLSALVEQDYRMNRRKTLRRITEYRKHLEPHFRRCRVSTMTTERINAYIIKRQDQGATSCGVCWKPSRNIRLRNPISLLMVPFAAPWSCRLMM